ncbi:NAD(P)H-dependent oxidoreductase [Litoribacillus peritrichatus]|uniref:NADPH-dependent FMN reductase n=1 Tax=Litoribacillus peritrichatus TaxID=718191 RepID=A0ABP7MT46_9GAMM
MTKATKIIAFAGSLRKDSFNAVLVKQAAEAALYAGSEVEVVNLADFDIPLFNEELESNTPEGVQQLKDKIRDADGLLVASPEYNGSISGVLKNALDWVSRTEPDQKPAFRDTTVALLSTSPGGLGGIRGLNHVRDIFVGMGSLVLSNQIVVGSSYQAFDQSGKLTDESMASRVEQLSQELVSTIQKLKD